MGVNFIVIAIALLPAYLGLLSPNRVTVSGYRSSRIDNHGQTSIMSSRLEEETIFSSSQTMKEPRLDRLPTIIYKLVDDEQDALRAADLCIDVFFGKVKNPIHGLLLQKLRRQQSFDLLQRFWHRPSDDSMVTAKDSKGNLLGFAETFIWSVDAEIYSSYLGYPASAPLVEVNGRIYLPKLANLAVVPSCRKMGMGRQLVEACITQARAWGYDQILLQVEADNKAARAFYRKLGFEELLTDMSEKRYDTGGLYLSLVPAPKVLLRKVISLDLNR